MITIEGEPYRLCSGVTRRDALKIGTLGLAGFALPDLLRMQSAAAGEFRTTKGRARSIIMVHLGGGPSQVDTYDPKPDAPVEIRGEFKAIGTKVPGVQLCELFPKQAEIMDQLSLIRSVHRVLPEEHASSLMVTGYSNTERRAAGEHPSIGSVLARMRPQPEAKVPPYVSLRGYNIETGLASGFIGAEYDPLVTDGPGRGDLKLRVTNDRLLQRKKLLEKMDGFRRAVDVGMVKSQDAFSQRALEIVSSSDTFDALDVGKETKETRDRYGNDHFVLARRLVERGCQSVAIEVGGWDTHSGNFTQLRQIMPPLDKAIHALITDLKQMGKYDETLLVVWGEFGRTPKVNGTAGRDHWPSVMSAMIAGGGLKMGQVIGRSDAQGADVEDRPVRVREVVATLYHALGIDPAMLLIDPQNRPIPLIHDEQPIRELIG